MAETKQIVFKYTEVVEALLKQQGIHDGIWGIFVRFGIKGANIGEDPVNLRPAAIVPILEIGLQRFPEENSIAVNAAKVNPGKDKVESAAPRRERHAVKRKAQPKTEGSS